MLVYKKNLISDLTSKYKPEALDIDAFNVEVHVDVDEKDFEEMRNYSTFLAEAHDAIQNEVIFPIIDEVAKQLAAEDRAVYAAGKLGIDKIVKKHKTAAEGVLKQATKDINEGVQHVLTKAWERVLKLEKNVRVFKIKATVHVVLSCVALSLSIAALATTPITAVGAVAGAAGILQSVGTIAKNLRDLGVKLPSLMEDLQKQFIKYRKKAEELKKKMEAEARKAEEAEEEGNTNMKKKEAAKVAASGLTGGLSDMVIIKLGKALPSLDALKADVGLFETKIDELETSQKHLSRELNKLLDKSAGLVGHYEELEKAFNAYLSDLNSKGAKCPKKVMEGQAKIIMPKKREAMEYEKKTKDAIKKIDDVRKDVTAYRTVQEDFQDKVDTLIKIHKTETVALFTKIVVVLGSVAVGGATSGWDKAGDVVTNVYSIGSSIFDAGSETLIDKIGA